LDSNISLGFPVKQSAPGTERLPADAYDALVCIAAGFTVDETVEELDRGKGSRITADDFASALKTPESRRTFWLVEDDKELQKMLDEPLEFWRIFLHPSQRKLVERTWNGPVLVRGGAGTGKTVVAMHRARYLAEHLIAKSDVSGKCSSRLLRRILPPTSKQI
jgi:hypothetical protein